MNLLRCQGPFFSFGHLTNVPYMTEVWRTWLPTVFEEAVEINSCAIQYARCRTHLAETSWAKSFLGINYEFELAAGQNSGFHKPTLYCKAFLDGNSAVEAEKLRLRYQQQNKAIDFQHISELDMLVWRFPNDPSLPQLQELIDPARAVYHLPYGKLPFDNQDAITSLAISVIRYRPEQRCILRFDMAYADSVKPLTLYAKIYESDKGEQVYRLMQQTESLLKPTGHRTAKALHYSPKITTVWQEALAGIPLADVLS
jgi:hypothetical protein